MISVKCSWYESTFASYLLMPWWFFGICAVDFYWNMNAPVLLDWSQLNNGPKSGYSKAGASASDEIKIIIRGRNDSGI